MCNLFLVFSTSPIDCPERLISEMTCHVSSGTLNSTHSATRSHLLRLSILPVIAGTTSSSTWWRSCWAGFCSRCCGGWCKPGTVASRASKASMASPRLCCFPSRRSTLSATALVPLPTAARVPSRCWCFRQSSAPSRSVSLPASSSPRYFFAERAVGPWNLVFLPILTLVHWNVSSWV